MGRRQNTLDQRVLVAVAPAMSDLRATQQLLNRFLWSSELSYGYMLANAPKVFPDAQQSASEALGHIVSGAWYPNNQGRIKLPTTIGKVLQQVADNTIHIYRAVLVYFGSAFEDYLDKRIGSKRETSSWGPYVKSLSLPELANANFPVSLKTLVRADICRNIRNRIVHPPFTIPTSFREQMVTDWQTKIIKQIKGTRWFNSECEKTVKEAFGQVIAQAVNLVKGEENAGKNTPIEYFYSLFNFTNLDTLAFEIEEALIGEGEILDGRVARKGSYVNRRDLIVASLLD
jgi:hypothetical protein